MSSTISVSRSSHVLLAQAEPARKIPTKETGQTALKAPTIKPEERFPHLMKGILRFKPFLNIQGNVDRNMRLLEQSRIKAEADQQKRANAELEAKKVKQAKPIIVYDANQGYSPHVDCSRGRK